MAVALIRLTYIVNLVVLTLPIPKPKTVLPGTDVLGVITTFGAEAKVLLKETSAEAIPPPDAPGTETEPQSILEVIIKLLFLLE